MEIVAASVVYGQHDKVCCWSAFSFKVMQGFFLTVVVTQVTPIPIIRFQAPEDVLNA